MTHICVSKLTIIGSDNGLSPGRRQAIIWTNAGLLSFGSLGTNLSEILIEIHTVSSKKMHLKMSSGKWRPFYVGLNVLNNRCMMVHVVVIFPYGRQGSVCPISHWSRDKMAATSQTIFWNAFTWMKMCESRLRFHWSLFLRAQLTIFQHWFR